MLSNGRKTSSYILMNLNVEPRVRMTQLCDELNRRRKSLAPGKNEAKIRKLKVRKSYKAEDFKLYL